MKLIGEMENFMLNNIFKERIEIEDNFASLGVRTNKQNQLQTNDSFEEKWIKYESKESKERFYSMQKKWYLKLYGFQTEESLSRFLSTKKFIFDAGCGLGYKAKWFADLSPESIVVGMDFSNACKVAAKNYKDTKNLYFIKGDISKTPFLDSSIDFISCDQVIMHTENPKKTFSELTRILRRGGQFACYVYAKKALPRELLDEHFRKYCKSLSQDDLWDMSKKLTKLGKILSELNVKIDVPEIPQLGIQGGKYDIQRFIYWNFLKCFWNEDLGADSSDMINFDWYSPSNATRYNEKEFRQMITENSLNIYYFHKEEACYSGRFCK